MEDMSWQAWSVMVILLSFGTQGIRPAFYYQDDEIVAMASERPALMTALKSAIQQNQRDPNRATLWL